MAKPFKGIVNIDVTESVADWGPYTQPIAPEGTPNVLYIVLDDVGCSAMECFGGLIDTPNINRIADRGLLYTNFQPGSWPPERANGRSDVAEEHPEKLQELIGLWWAEAGHYGALPLENREAVEH